MRHRGPDDEGVYADSACAIGMRRLSIIDLATGHQPILNEDGALGGVFNGEIYNYQDLRRDLIRSGHRFATDSDTETLVHLYEEYGPESVKRLRGMFAYALWDAREQRLFLARDRFGKKPLYYANIGGSFYFASELKCLRAAGIPVEIDPEALQLYLQFGYVPDPWSIYRNIRKLRPGHWMTFDRRGRIRDERYWSVPPPCETAALGFREEQACEEIRHVFEESVRLRMIADVPVGAFLSGGIDSSLVVAVMSKAAKERVRTFSIGWKEDQYNELPYARLVARQYGTDHYEKVVQPDIIDLAPRLIQMFDEPFADSSAIPTYVVSEYAAQHVKVVLSGDGGDELFGGYWSFFWMDQRRWMERLPHALRPPLRLLAGALPSSTYGRNFLRAISLESAVERYFDFTMMMPYLARQRLFEPEWMTTGNESYFRDVFGDAILPDESYDGVSQAMQFEATAKLAGDILVKVDRMSMANSLEVRCPLLDQELADVAARIPNRSKTRNGQGKLILLKALAHSLPPELLERPKSGFAVPLDRWFRGLLRPMLHDSLTSSKWNARGITRPAALRLMLDEHDSRRRNNAPALWMLFALDLWFRANESPVEGARPA